MVPGAPRGGFVIFRETKLPGAYVLDADRYDDERGFYARLFVREEFEARGLETALAQCGFSLSRLRGTLRGLHYQADPHGQAKLIRCSRGAVYDVIVDLRPGSPTRLAWTAVELTAENFRLLYVPTGFAHGFITLENDTEITYLMSTPQVPASERGIRWDDPAVAIPWPLQPTVISARDRAFPLLTAAQASCG